MSLISPIVISAPPRFIVPDTLKLEVRGKLTVEVLGKLTVEVILAYFMS